MLPVLYLSVVAFAATLLAIYVRREQRIQQASMLALTGTLVGAVIGATMGGLVDIASGTGVVLTTGIMIGAPTGAALATFGPWLTRSVRS